MRTRLPNLRAKKPNSSWQNANSARKNIPPTWPLNSTWACSILKLAKLTEAIGEFQKAQQNPNRRIAAMSYLAQCFAKRNMNDSAVRMFQNAIKEKAGIR